MNSIHIWRRRWLQSDKLSSMYTFQTYALRRLIIHLKLSLSRSSLQSQCMTSRYF